MIEYLLFGGLAAAATILYVLVRRLELHYRHKQRMARLHEQNVREYFDRLIELRRQCYRIPPTAGDGTRDA